MTHKSEDYKISAVKYYLNNKDNIRKTCKIFDCKKSTLQRTTKISSLVLIPTITLYSFYIYDITYKANYRKKCIHNFIIYWVLVY